MKCYRAWRLEDGKIVKEVEFDAPSIRSAKAKATKQLGVEHGTWNEGTIFLPDRSAVSGYTKSLQGRDGATGLYPTIQMVELTN